MQATSELNSIIHPSYHQGFHAIFEDQCYELKGLNSEFQKS
jgi:hypothetical protein